MWVPAKHVATSGCAADPACSWHLLVGTCKTTWQPQDAQQTLYALGIAASEAAAAPTQKQRGLKRSRKAPSAEMEKAAGRGQTLEEAEVELHDVDITLPDFEVRSEVLFCLMGRLINANARTWRR